MVINTIQNKEGKQKVPEAADSNFKRFFREADTESGREGGMAATPLEEGLQRAKAPGKSVCQEPPEGQTEGATGRFKVAIKEHLFP